MSKTLSIKPGNWMTDPAHENQLVEIISVNKNDPNECRVSEVLGGYAYSVDLRKLNRIELNKELIGKIGFNKVDEMDYAIGLPIGDGADLILSLDTFSDDFAFGIEVKGENGERVKLKDVDYLDEIQNFYYYASGVLLEIDPEIF